MADFSTTSDVIRVLTVPTNMNKPRQQEIDMRKMTANDLDTLRRNDPFLYHSIPQVNKATLSVKTVDHSEILKDTESTLTPQTQASSSSLDESSSSLSCRSNSNMIVPRKTRITTEVAPSMLLDELICGHGRLDSTSSIDDREEYCSSSAILDELMDIQD